MSPSCTFKAPPLTPDHAMQEGKEHIKVSTAFVSSSRGEDDSHDPLIISWLTFWLTFPWDIHVFPEFLAPRQGNPNPLPVT